MAKDTTPRGAHYAGEIQPIDAMEATATAWSRAGMPETGLCLAQAIKYMMRPGKGQVVEDLKKAEDYLHRAMNHVDGVGGKWGREPKQELGVPAERPSR